MIRSDYAENYALDRASIIAFGESYNNLCNSDKKILKARFHTWIFFIITAGPNRQDMDLTTNELRMFEKGIFKYEWNDFKAYGRYLEIVRMKRLARSKEKKYYWIQHPDGIGRKIVYMCEEEVELNYHGRYKEVCTR